MAPTEEEDKKGDFNHVERLDQQFGETELDGGGHHHVEIAAEILRKAGDIEYTEEEDKLVLRKIDLWIVSECLSRFLVVKSPWLGDLGD